MIEMYYKDVSSIVNDGIGEILNLFKKAQKVTLFIDIFMHIKNINRQIKSFFTLDAFIRRKSIKF